MPGAIQNGNWIQTDRERCKGVFAESPIIMGAHRKCQTLLIPSIGAILSRALPSRPQMPTNALKVYKVEPVRCGRRCEMCGTLETAELCQLPRLAVHHVMAIVLQLQISGRCDHRENQPLLHNPSATRPLTPLWYLLPGGHVCLLFKISLLLKQLLWAAPFGGCCP